MGSVLQGKVALVTGASRGIGEGIARRFAAEGATVIVTARTIEASGGVHEAGNVDGKGKSALAGSLNEVVEQIRTDGGEVIALRCDVGDPASRAELYDAAMKMTGRVDILVNNAATAVFGKSWKSVREDE